MVKSPSKSKIRQAATRSSSDLKVRCFKLIIIFIYIYTTTKLCPKSVDPIFTGPSTF
ncbi:hypothetical protein Mapa_008218 [Marchantia paleacea]|nr:hypothetical protein Mapa_008218 [Marchantia paleacea]